MYKLLFFFFCNENRFERVLSHHENVKKKNKTNPIDTYF